MDWESQNLDKEEIPGSGESLGGYIYIYIYIFDLLPALNGEHL